MSNIDDLVLSILEEGSLTKSISNFVSKHITDPIRHKKILDILKNREYRGNLDLSNIEGIPDLGNLRVVYGNIDLRWSKITSLGKLERIEGNLNAQHTGLEDLGELKYAKGSVDIAGCKMVDLGNLEEVEGDLNIYFNGNIKDLGHLRYVGGDLNADRCIRLESLSRLEEVDGSIHLKDCNNLVSIGWLKKVGKDLILIDSKVRDLYKLVYVGGSIIISYSSNVDVSGLRKGIKVKRVW